jgi:3-oxoacyl-[acyl-carrier protein] reductase
VADVNLQGAERTAAEIGEGGRKAIGLKVDVTSEKDTTRLAGTAWDTFGRIDILVNNAGLARNLSKTPIEQLRLEDWNQLINVNLTGVFLVSKAVIPYMKRAAKGKIINVSSAVALSGKAMRQDYIAAKAGVIGLTRALAVDLGPYNINVNAITPGGVEMAEARGEPTRPVADFMLAGRQINKPLFPKDLEGVVAFLASDDSDMITGQVINVDGGVVFVG